MHATIDRQRRNAAVARFFNQQRQRLFISAQRIRAVRIGFDDRRGPIDDRRFGVRRHFAFAQGFHDAEQTPQAMRCAAVAFASRHVARNSVGMRL